MRPFALPIASIAAHRSRMMPPGMAAACASWKVSPATVYRPPSGTGTPESRPGPVEPGDATLLQHIKKAIGFAKDGMTLVRVRFGDALDTRKPLD
jgi:hypothetical protein